MCGDGSRSSRPPRPSRRLVQHHSTRHEPMRGHDDETLELAGPMECRKVLCRTGQADQLSVHCTASRSAHAWRSGPRQPTWNWNDLHPAILRVGGLHLTLDYLADAISQSMHADEPDKPWMSSSRMGLCGWLHPRDVQGAWRAYERTWRHRSALKPGRLHFLFRSTATWLSQRHSLEDLCRGAGPVPLSSATQVSEWGLPGPEEH